MTSLIYIILKPAKYNKGPEKFLTRAPAAGATALEVSHVLLNESES